MAVESIFGRQVKTLVDGMHQLVGSVRADEQLLERLRRSVSGAVVSLGQVNVVSAALGELNGTQAGDRLKEMVSECSKHFYLEDRIMSVLVVPVAVRLKSRMDGAVTITEAREEDLKTLALLMSRRLGSKNVFFDTKLYGAQELAYVKPGKLLELGLALEGGNERPESSPKGLGVASKAEADWQMVYLLGFEINEVGEECIANSDEAQRELLKWRCYAEQAVGEVDSVLFNREVNADVKCHGIWYGDSGLKVGEDLIRGYRLENLIKSMEHGVTGMYFWYTKDELRNCVRLMVKSSLMTIEHKWKLFAGEEIDGFKAALDKAIDMAIPEGDVIGKRELSMMEYEKKSIEEGVIWQ